MCFWSNLVHNKHSSGPTEVSLFPGNSLLCLEYQTHYTCVSMVHYPWKKTQQGEVFLYLTTHKAMKSYGGSEGTAPRIFNPDSQLQVQVSLPPGNEQTVPNAQWGWVGPRASLDTVSIPCPCREANPSRPTCSLVTISNELLRHKEHNENQSSVSRTRRYIPGEWALVPIGEEAGRAPEPVRRR
jgi:hypothetical protein